MHENKTGWIDKYAHAVVGKTTLALVSRNERVRAGPTWWPSEIAAPRGEARAR